MSTREPTSAPPPAAAPARPSRPWDAERVVERDEALALAGRFVAVAAIERLGAGWDNTAWLVRSDTGDRFVVRFPRRRVAVPLLEREIAALPGLTPRLPLAVTAPAFSGRDAGDWPFAGYRFIPGQALALRGGAPGIALGAAVGAFVRALHTGPVDGLGRDELGKVDVRRRLDVTRALAARAGAELPEEVLELALAVPLDRRPVVPVHGDLDARHVLVDDDGQATGVIDWGDLHAGDPATDLAFAFSALAGEARDAFFEAYGLVWDGLPTLALARFRAIHVALAVYDWATDLGDAALVGAARAALARAVKYT